MALFVTPDKLNSLRAADHDHGDAHCPNCPASRKIGFTQEGRSDVFYACLRCGRVVRTVPLQEHRLGSLWAFWFADEVVTQERA